mgnify:CR=1 FL=1
MNDTPLDPEELAVAQMEAETLRWKHAVGRANDADEVADWEKKNRVPTRPGFAGYRRIMRRMKP